MTFDKQTIRSVRTHLIMIILSIFIVYPMVWWIGAAFKTNAEIPLPTIFPEVWQFSNFTGGWYGLPKYGFERFYLNSAMIIIPIPMMKSVLLTTILTRNAICGNTVPL